MVCNIQWLFLEIKEINSLQYWDVTGKENRYILRNFVSKTGATTLEGISWLAFILPWIIPGLAANSFPYT